MWCFVIRVSSGVGGSPSFRYYVGVTIRSLLALQLHWLQGGIRESLEMAFGVEHRVCWDFFSFPLPYRLSVGTASADLHSGVLAFLAEPYTTREPGCQAILRIRLCRSSCTCISSTTRDIDPKSEEIWVIPTISIASIYSQIPDLFPVSDYSLVCRMCLGVLTTIGSHSYWWVVHPNWALGWCFR